MLSRRNLFSFAPAVILTPGLLMPVKKWIEPALSPVLMPPLDQWGGQVCFTLGDTFTVSHLREGYSIEWRCIGAGTMYGARFAPPRFIPQSDPL